MNDTIDDMTTDHVPLWRIEDTLIGAKKAAQSGNRERCKEQTQKALEMLEK